LFSIIKISPFISAGDDSLCPQQHNESRLLQTSWHLRYRRDFLDIFTNYRRKAGKLEALEQLRALEYGYKIKSFHYSS